MLLVSVMTAVPIIQLNIQLSVYFNKTKIEKFDVSGLQIGEEVVGVSYSEES